MAEPGSVGPASGSRFDSGLVTHVGMGINSRTCSYDPHMILTAPWAPSGGGTPLAAPARGHSTQWQHLRAPRA